VRRGFATGQSTNNELSEERLRFAAQLGASGVLLNTRLLPGAHWEYEDLLWLRTRCEKRGLRLEALENVPISFYDKAMLGLPGRDEQIEHYQKPMQNMGRAGITSLGYHWMPNGVWRSPSYQVRSGHGHPHRDWRPFRRCHAFSAVSKLPYPSS
jgi:mannonate dehydratase